MYDIEHLHVIAPIYRILPSWSYRDAAEANLIAAARVFQQLDKIRGSMLSIIPFFAFSWLV